MGPSTCFFHSAGWGQGAQVEGEAKQRLRKTQQTWPTHQILPLLDTGRRSIWSRPHGSLGHPPPSGRSKRNVADGHHSTSAREPATADQGHPHALQSHPQLEQGKAAEYPQPLCARTRCCLPAQTMPALQVTAAYNQRWQPLFCRAPPPVPVVRDSRIAPEDPRYRNSALPFGQGDAATIGQEAAPNVLTHRSGTFEGGGGLAACPVQSWTHRTFRTLL